MLKLKNKRISLKWTPRLINAGGTIVLSKGRKIEYTNYILYPLALTLTIKQLITR